MQTLGTMSLSPFDPKGFLDLAKSLADNPGGGQAEYRSALSRAYYAVFLTARESLVAQKIISPTMSPSDHPLVISALRAINTTVGNQLDKLRTKRNRADYDLAAQVSQAEAQQTVGTAYYLESKL